MCSNDERECLDVLIAGFLAEVAVRGDAKRLGLARQGEELHYVIGRVESGLYLTWLEGHIERIAQRHGSRPTIIDVSTCRTVSSVELSLIGFILTVAHRNGSQVIVRHPSEILRRAMRLAGFELLATLEP